DNDDPTRQAGSEAGDSGTQEPDWTRPFRLQGDLVESGAEELRDGQRVNLSGQGTGQHIRPKSPPPAGKGFSGVQQSENLNQPLRRQNENHREVDAEAEDGGSDEADLVAGRDPPLHPTPKPGTE